MILPHYFKNVPGAQDVLIMLCLCIKGDKEAIIKQIPRLSNIILASVYAIKEVKKADKKVEEEEYDEGDYSEEAVEEQKEDEQMKDSSFKLVSESVAVIVELIVKLLSKDKSMKLDYYIDTIEKTLNTLEEYYSKKEDSKGADLQTQRDFIVFILGICKGDFNMIGVLAKKLGYFENDAIKGLFNIFMKFQSIIFKNGAFGLPEVARKLRSSHFAIEGDLKDGNYKEISKKGMQMVSSALKQGATAIGKYRLNLISLFPINLTFV